MLEPRYSFFFFLLFMFSASQLTLRYASITLKARPATSTATLKTEHTASYLVFMVRFQAQLNCSSLVERWLRVMCTTNGSSFNGMSCRREINSNDVSILMIALMASFLRSARKMRWKKIPMNNHRLPINSKDAKCVANFQFIFCFDAEKTVSEN